MPAKKTTTKKTASKSSKPALPFDLKQAKPPKVTTRFLFIVLIALAIILIIYRLGPWLFPAAVNNRPISRFELYRRMELAYGQQTLDDLINERVLQVAIAQSGVQVDTDRVQQEMANIETQFQELGGLDEALKQRGITRSELEEQIHTQLAVEEILKDKIVPSEQEIQEYYDQNVETLFEDQTLEEATSGIIETLKQSKLRDAFLEWFAEVKKNAVIKTFSQTL